MPEPTGIFIKSSPGGSEPGSGESATQSDNGGADKRPFPIDGSPGKNEWTGNADNDGFREPETERINAGGPRRNARGGVDGRTRAGRAARNSAGGSAQTISSNLEKFSLTDIIVSLHTMAAAFAGVQELEMDPSEAEKLSKGIQEVGKYYAISMDPKKVAWANLIMIAGGIYGTRFIAYRTRKANEPKKEKVVTMQSAPPASGAPKPYVNGAPKTGPAKSFNEMNPSDLWQEPAE